MIRPITVICWVLALGAGLYLYRAKHEVELMDKHIEQIAKETSDVRADSRRLLDDWLRLGEPEQLHKYSDEYLGLKTIAPTQFARLSDLPSRLPAPQADPPDPETVPVAQSPDAAPDGAASAETQQATASTDQPDEAGADDLPVPPIPPAIPVVSTVVLPAVTTVPLQAKPVTPRIAASRPRPEAEPRVADAPAAEPRTAAPVTPEEARQVAVGRPAGSSSPASREIGLPPLQAQIGQAQAGPAQTGRQTVATETARPEPRTQEAQAPETPTRGWRTQGWQNPTRLAPAENDQARGEPAPALEARGSQGGSQVGTQVAIPARRTVPERGLPPLQAQGATPVQAQGGGSAYANQAPAPRYAGGSYPAQPVGRPVPWSPPPRVAETQADPRLRPPPQFGDPRGPQMTQQAPAVGGSSLLGMPRGPVPLPLPAPMPVSATWPSPGTSR